MHHSITKGALQVHTGTETVDAYGFTRLFKDIHLECHEVAEAVVE